LLDEEGRHKNRHGIKDIVQTTDTKQQVKDYIMSHTKKGQTFWLSDIVAEIQDTTTIGADLLTINEAINELISERKLSEKGQSK
jgi:hypothetical protein